MKKGCKSGYFDYAEGMTHEIDARELNNFFGLKNKKVLDVGCCFGYQVKHLRLLGADAYGVDWSDYACEKAFDKNYVFKEDITRETRFEDNEFDFIFGLALLEHLNLTQLTKALKEIKRILKPNKPYLFYVPFPEDEDYDLDGSHVIAEGQDWWAERLTKAFGNCDLEMSRKYEESSFNAQKFSWHIFVGFNKKDG